MHVEAADWLQGLLALKEQAEAVNHPAGEEAVSLPPHTSCSLRLVGCWFSGPGRNFMLSTRLA